MASGNSTETKYASALLEFEAKHFKTALPVFKQVKAMWKENPFVDAYINDAQKAIVDKRDQTPPSVDEIGTRIGEAILAVGLLGFVGMYRRRRRRAQQVLVAELAVHRAAAVLAPPATKVAARKAPPKKTAAQAAAPARKAVAKPVVAARKPLAKAAPAAKKGAAKPAARTPPPVSGGGKASARPKPAPKRSRSAG